MKLLLRTKRKHNLILIVLTSFLWAALWLSMGNFPAWAASSGILSNSKAAVDISQVSEGILKIRYTGGKQVKIKVQITKDDKTIYTYNLNNSGTYETFPLTEGNGNYSFDNLPDGTYSVKVLENVSGNRYSVACSVSVEVALSNSFAPFLHPNQFVNYTEDTKAVELAKELTENKKDDLEKISAVFDYVVDHISYDDTLAATAESGYIPNLDQVLKKQTGICFDYAAVMAAMLRSQNIPCKLVVGYAGTTYHAWINVYVSGKGWVDKFIYFDGKTWTLMDPTTLSSGGRSKAAKNFVTNADNYTQKYAY